jgi:hypothetical protein
LIKKTHLFLFLRKNTLLPDANCPGNCESVGFTPLLSSTTGDGEEALGMGMGMDVGEEIELNFIIVGKNLLTSNFVFTHTVT